MAYATARIRIGRAWCWAAILTAAAAGATSGCTKEPAGGDVPGAAKTGPAPTETPVAQAAASPPASAASAAADPGANSNYTLPPSKGPAPHQFQPVTLLRSGPSGDLEMQLTGDGIYRIRDHAHGRSYAGDGKLTEAQTADWAAAMKDWEALKDRYVPDPPPAGADTVEIIYGGKRVVASSASRETPKTFRDAYERLLALNEQSKREAGAAETPGRPGDVAAAPAEATASPAANRPATAPSTAPAGSPQGVTPKENSPKS